MRPQRSLDDEELARLIRRALSPGRHKSRASSVASEPLPRGRIRIHRGSKETPLREVLLQASALALDDQVGRSKDVVEQPSRFFQ